MGRARSAETTERPLAGLRPDGCEIVARERKLWAGHGDRAMMEADAAREIDGAVEHVDRKHVIGERYIANRVSFSGQRRFDFLKGIINVRETLG